MNTSSNIVQSTRFKVGWLLLLILSALMTLNHLVLIFFAPKEADLFVGWATFNLYATLVLWIPFRRGEKWAWLTSWILVIGLASAILFDASIGVWYLGVAIVMAVGQYLTWPAFFQSGVRPA